MMATLTSRTIQALQEDDLLGEQRDIIDFGCGTGLFGLEFTPFARTLTGVDTSEGMLEVFERKTEGHDHIRSLRLNLEEEETDLTADLIVTAMAFHHLDDPGAMVGRFKKMLRDNGVIALVDLDAEDGTFHPDNKGMGVRHFGFSKDTVEQWAHDHALSLHYSIILELKKNDRTYPIFLAILK